MKEKARTEKQIEKAYKRHKRIWAFSRLILTPYFKMKYGFTAEQAPDIEGSYLVLANHTANLDPFLCGMSFKKQMYFMASEHVYRWGLLSNLLYWTYEPIAKMKGSSDTLAVMKTIRTLRNGKNVCLFPEGNRTFNGKTGPILEATGKIVKTSGASLVTYRTTGGYFTNPRWGYKIRKGKMTGKVVAVYPKEQLKTMTPLEITEIIRRDLYENAFEEQIQSPIRFKGKNRAEGMECAVCVCPKCRQVDTIATTKNTVFCKKCGLKTQYSEYCFFDDGFDFHTIEEWDSWQNDFYDSLIQEKKALASTEPLFSDDKMVLKTLTPDHQEVVVGQGTLYQYLDRLEFVVDSTGEKTTISITDLPDIALFQKDNLVFTDAKGIHYEGKGENLKNVRKYVYVSEQLRKQLSEASQN
ncbi:MAG: 1-acyl-sn-glycerol-3-phosphate acyltransferase [Treponema sp.]|nr:1-acyl-sn-glycerol-3-phosphate acyltransferase [Treponema sp.]